MTSPIPIGSNVWCVTARGFSSNCYIFRLADTSLCTLIDPGMDSEAITAALVDLKLNPVAVFCTHGHFDHIGSAEVFQRLYGCPVYLHNLDLKIMRSANFMLMAFKIEGRIKLPHVTFLEAEMSTIDVNGHEFRFQRLPGHTPGSIVIKSGSFLFTGDTLYAEGFELSKLPGGKLDDLRRSAKQIFAQYSGTDQICPGHGTTASLSWIQNNNLALRRFLKQQ